MKQPRCDDRLSSMRVHWYDTQASGASLSHISASHFTLAGVIDRISLICFPPPPKINNLTRARGWGNLSLPQMVALSFLFRRPFLFWTGVGFKQRPRSSLFFNYLRAEKAGRSHSYIKSHKRMCDAIRSTDLIKIFLQNNHLHYYIFIGFCGTYQYGGKNPLHVA